MYLVGQSSCISAGSLGRVTTTTFFTWEPSGNTRAREWTPSACNIALVRVTTPAVFLKGSMSFSPCRS